MRCRPAVVAGIASVALLGAQLALAQSYYYESRTTMSDGEGKSGKPDRIRGWVDEEKVKLEFPEGGRGGQFGSGTYLLTTNGGQDVYLVDPKEKTYSRFDLEEMMSFASAAMGEGMFEINMSDFSSEKLEQGAGGSLLGRSTERYKWRTQYTMEMNTMGMSRSSRNDTTQEVWVHSGLGGGGWRMWYGMLPAGMREEVGDAWIENSGLLDGFPMKSVATTKSTNRKGKTTTMTSEMVITELREESIAASTFEIPGDYTETQLIPDETQDAMSRFKGMFGRKKKQKKTDG